MKRLPFVKLSGAGNDFILVEAGDIRDSSRPALARRLCPRRTAVGADGLLVVRRRGKSGSPELDYYNADGSRAFCGNGSRCAAWWMRRSGWTGRRFSLGSIEGPLACEIVGPERVRIHMPRARGLRLGLKRAAAGKTYTVSTLDTGVPHAVVRVRGLDRFPVSSVGRILRRALGANVDFVELSRGGVRVRTYERGVEDETLACGTGVVASAILASIWTGRPGPVSVRTRGGLLKAGFVPAAGGRFDGVWLEGPARIIYRGEATL